MLLNNFLLKSLRKTKKTLRNLKELRIIVDSEMKLGNHHLQKVSYNCSINKEELSRTHIFNIPGESLNFLDVGAQDGKLHYLLGIRENLKFDEAFYTKNRKRFLDKFSYYGVDLESKDKKNVLTGDICDTNYLDKHKEHIDFFDVVYSNNVFEHLSKPWIAARNLFSLTKKNGIIVIVVPFSQRYHESPIDYFRYTHTGIVSLFEDYGPLEVLESGYDIMGRRNDWQGEGSVKDIVPCDKFGAWRETWFTLCILKKL